MDLVPNQWYAALDPREVPAGRPVGFRRLGHDLVLWRDRSGRVRAAHDRCPHRAAALSIGAVQDGCVACPFHGFRFDADGACVAVPAHPDRGITPKLALTMVPAREAHDLVWLWSGPDAPPDGPIPFFDTAGTTWAGSQVTKQWPVHYTRAVENQLDWAHLAFVHATTIGRFAPVNVDDLVTTVDGARIHSTLPDQGSGLTFIGPNVWQLVLSPKLFNFLAFVPIDDGHVQEEKGPNASRNRLQTTTLLHTIEEYEFDAALGGGRRDEEKARAKERFFSHRDDFGQWDPKNQRPELWNIFNGRKHHGEHFRVFPLSNWTEMDVWQYIKLEKIDLPTLYFAHEREVVFRGGTWLAITDFITVQPEESIERKQIRFRTIGDATCTGAVESGADTVDSIIEEVAAARQTERGTRADDKRSETAMEDRKKEGYF